MGANFWVSMEENFEQTTQTEMFEDTSAYKVRLDNFEGPLDLLLHLIKEAKLDIATVQLSAITEQYLEYMEQIPELDMEKASEFIEVAATLIEIKSKKLLPKPEEIRKAYFMGEWLDTAVYKRDNLKAGNSFIGPAIIEETGATSVVGPGDKVTVDERMNLVVKIANHETGRMEILEEN